MEESVHPDLPGAGHSSARHPRTRNDPGTLLDYARPLPRPDPELPGTLTGFRRERRYGSSLPGNPRGHLHGAAPQAMVW